MQTPETTPDRRKSPLSSLTQRSWRNLRSKMQGLSPNQRDENRGQFVVLSSAINAYPERSPQSPPLIFIDPSGASSREQLDSELASSLPATPPPIMPDLPRLSESLLARDQPLHRSDRLQHLGEPFDEDAAGSESDGGSAFSFNREMSRKYYKDATDMDPASGSAQSLRNSMGSFASYGSYGSFASYVSNGSYVSSSDLFYGDGLASDSSWAEDLGHLDEPDYLTALIAEANEVPSEDLESLQDAFPADTAVRRTQSVPTSAGNSMHRQLSFKCSASAPSLLEDARLKRVRSTISTPSTVWPILE